LANDSLDFVQRGKVSIVRRQYAEAVKICRLGLLAHPTLLEGRLVLGMALTALQRWDEVLAEMRVALEVDGTSALAWLLKGEALVGKGDYAQAEQSLKRAKELDPSNTKADQLLAEIQVARAAGFEGIPAEPTDTKVYPAKAGDDSKLQALAAPLTADGTMPGHTGERELPEAEYGDDATEVDPDPSDQIPISAGALRTARQKKVTPARALRPKLSDLIDEGEEVSTDTFVPPRGGLEASYEPPAHDDYAERARPRAPSLGEEPSMPGFTGKTPLERMGQGNDPHRSAAGGISVKHAPAVEFDTSEPSIELSGVDLIPTTGESHEFDLSDQPPVGDEDEESQTDRRAKRRPHANEDEVGTRPETPDPRKRISGIRTPEPLPPPPRGPNSHEAPTSETANPPWQTPGVVRVPLPRTAPSPTIDLNVWGKIRYALVGDRPGSFLALLATAFVAVVAIGVVTGLLVREWRMRGRVAKRYELARQKLASGNYPGFEAAEVLYRQILAERDDPKARSLRARTLAQMAFEFGDGREAAERAVAALGDKDASPEANAARIYLALARGELDKAANQATALRRKQADGVTSYLVGRAELLLERSEAAAEALRAAADQMPRDPLTLHALGLAEAAAHREDKALDAYRKALEANANHIATIVDRALLAVRRQPRAGHEAEREAARGALEGVVAKLQGDSSPAQLARAHLGLGELAIQRGDLDGARRELSEASARRRDDPLLSEELAAALASAFDLEQAEKEALKAKAMIVGSPRLQPKLVLADVALKRGRWSEVLKTLEDAGATRLDALLLRAEANLQLGRRDAARFDVDQAEKLAPDSTAPRVIQARIDVVEGKAERAQRDLERIERVAKLPETAEALGEAFAGQRMRESAKFYYREAIRRDRLMVFAHLQLARLLHATGKLDEARQALDELLKLDPAYVPAQRERALTAFDAGDATAARDELDALVTRDPSPETLFLAARAHLALGDTDGAEQLLGKADPQAVPAIAEELQDLQARIFLAEHRPMDAAPLLRKLLSTATRGETPGLLMMAYLDNDQPDRAASVRLATPFRLRGAPEVLTARARLAIERGRDVTAEALSTEAITRLNRPGANQWIKAEALTVLGRSLWEQGTFRPALRTLKQATTIDPRSARAFYYYGLVLDEVRNKADARAAMETAVKNDPKLADALYYLGRLRAESGDPTSRDAFQKYLEVAPKGIYADEAQRALAGGKARKRRRFR
jgi:tetratricopeptide (TPR) repeat protein